jgi:hypothetical protein
MYVPTNPQSLPPGKMKALVSLKKYKPYADISKVARNSISDLQLHSNVKSYWVEGDADKRRPPFPHRKS